MVVAIISNHKKVDTQSFTIEVYFGLLINMFYLVCSILQRSLKKINIPTTVMNLVFGIKCIPQYSE